MPALVPLGIRLGAVSGHPVRGVTSGSCWARSPAPLEPALPLARMVHQWHAISRALAEPPRRRLSQLSAYFDLRG